MARHGKLNYLLYMYWDIEEFYMNYYRNCNLNYLTLAFWKEWQATNKAYQKELLHSCHPGIQWDITRAPHAWTLANTEVEEVTQTILQLITVEQNSYIAKSFPRLISVKINQHDHLIINQVIV